jgi:hypothetical protein
MFADGGTGDVENSGGILAILALFDAMFTVTFEFETGAEPQAKIKMVITSNATNETILSIKTNLKKIDLKWLCRFEGCVPGGQRRRSNRHGQVSNGFGR